MVPNPWGLLWASNAGTGPLPGAATFGAPATAGAAFQLYFKGVAAPTASDLQACPAPGGFPIPKNAVTHGFATDWVDPLITKQAQTDIATFVAADATVNSLVVLP